MRNKYLKCEHPPANILYMPFTFSLSVFSILKASQQQHNNHNYYGK